MKIFFIFLCFLAIGLNAKSKEPKVREGEHSLTLQWIESKPGKINFKKISKDTFEVEGEQRDPKTGNFLNISGTIKVRNPRELEFVGQIQTKVHHIFDGNTCLRNQVLIFKAHGKRKYWRMQDKLNCDQTTTDYIDIYF